MADLNKCSAQKLANTVQISSELADNIVKFRKQMGGIQNFDELVAVDGMTRSTMKKIKTLTKLGKMPRLKRARKKVIEERKNNQKNKIEKESRKKKTISDNENHNLTPEVALPLLRMNLSGSSPMSPRQSPIRIFTPVKLQPSKSGSKITAEYRILSSVNQRKGHDSSTFSSHFSTKVNPPSYHANKTGVKNQSDKHRKLPHNKEESIRSWLKGIQTHDYAAVNSSPIKNSFNRGKARDLSKIQIERPSSSNAKYHLLNSSEHRRSGHEKQFGNCQKPTSLSPKRRGPDTKSKNTNNIRPTVFDMNYSPKFDDKNIMQPAKHRNTYSSVKRPTHTAYEERLDKQKYRQTYRESSKLAADLNCDNPTEKRQLSGRKSSIKSFRELQARTRDSEDDRTFICRSSVVREKSITPTKAISGTSDSDVDSFSSDVSLIKRDKHSRKRSHDRSHKRRRQSRDRERSRHYDSPRDKENDDHKQACIII